MTENELLEKLFGLVRDLYTDKQADEIIQSFEAVFDSHETEEERLELLECWLDFYRLQKYKHIKQRRRPTYEERISACSACGYPSSHRHHLWDIATHGENAVTIQLCANCHEMHHLMYNALVRESEYSRKIVEHVMFSGKVSHNVVDKILGWCLATIRYEASNGWIDGAKGSKEWVEMRLRWSEYLQSQATQAVSP